MRILLHSEQLSERGTTTAILEYARFLRDSGNDCVIAFQKNHPVNNEEVIKKVNSEFEIFTYQYFWKIRKSQKDFDLGYFIKSGSDDGRIFTKKPSIVHAVFQEYQPHGDLYLYVSKWLADSMNNSTKNSYHREKHQCRTLNCNKFEYLDHAINMPEVKTNLRAKLGIPMNHTVGIRYGGKDTFDIPWVKEAIIEMLYEKQDIQFVFANTNKFIDHPRVHFLDTITEGSKKSEFLKTGDFFLHARNQGESFGLAILEAIKVGLPVLTYSGGLDLNHLNLVPNQLTYSDSKTLISLIYNEKFRAYSDIFTEIKNNYTREQVGLKLMNYISKLI
jgi:glycosyltransferase involved in cell wall biosynthesis